MSARNGISRRRTRRIARASRGGITCNGPERQQEKSNPRSAPFPAGFEQTQAAARTRMGGARVVVERDAESRAGRQAEAAIFHGNLRRLVDELLDPRVREVVEVFEDFVVRRRDRAMD